MRPGVTSAVLRWRVGAWLVGASLLLFILDLFVLHQGTGFWFLCLFLMILGGLVANPFRVIARLREGGWADPVVRLRPLGIIGFVVMTVLFLVPFAIGEWLLNLIGETFERRANRSIGEDPPPLTPDEETLAGHPPGPWPGADGFEDVFYDEQDPYRTRRWRPTRPFSRR